MFSVLSYGRLVARAVLGGLSQTDSRDYSLVTASCGFGKDFRKGILKKGMCYGDDACFVARHRTADVLGKCPGRGLRWLRPRCVTPIPPSFVELHMASGSASGRRQRSCLCLSLSP